MKKHSWDIVIIGAIILLSFYFIWVLNTYKTREEQHKKAVRTIQKLELEAKKANLQARVIHNSTPRGYTSRCMGLPLKVKQAILQGCIKNNLDPKLVMALIAKESSITIDATSPNGKDGGLMQLSKRYFGHINRYDPQENVKAGTEYLGMLVKRYGIRKGLIAYNCGPTRMKEGPPKKSIKYATAIMMMAGINEGGHQ